MQRLAEMTNPFKIKMKSNKKDLAVGVTGYKIFVPLLLVMIIEQFDYIGKSPHQWAIPRKGYRDVESVENICRTSCFTEQEDDMFRAANINKIAESYRNDEILYSDVESNKADEEIAGAVVNPQQKAWGLLLVIIIEKFDHIGGHPSNWTIPREGGRNSELVTTTRRTSYLWN